MLGFLVETNIYLNICNIYVSICGKEYIVEEPTLDLKC